MPHLAIPSIKISSIPELKDLHNLGQRNSLYLQQKVAMIPHQGKGVEVEGILGFVFRKVGEIGPKILVIKENRLFLIAPGNHVVKGTGKINPRSSSHGLSITRRA